MIFFKVSTSMEGSNIVSGSRFHRRRSPNQTQEHSKSGSLQAHNDISKQKNLDIFL